VGRATGHRLGMLVGWLKGVCPWSDAEDVAVFLVSGRPLRLAGPLQASLDMQNATYSLAFSPWISEETIVRTARLDGPHDASQLPEHSDWALSLVEDHVGERSVPCWWLLRSP
jgi:hypothetical protein